MQYSINREVLHRSKLLRFGELKIYSIKRVIPLTDIPLSRLDCIYTAYVECGIFIIENGVYRINHLCAGY